MNNLETLVVRRGVIESITWLDNLKQKAIKKSSYSPFIKECENVKQQLFESYKMIDIVTSENEQLKKEIAHFENKVIMLLEQVERQSKIINKLQETVEL